VFPPLHTILLHVQNLTKYPKLKEDATTGQYQPNGTAAQAGLNRAIQESGTGCVPWGQNLQLDL